MKIKGITEAQAAAMTTTYRIVSQAGQDHGTYAGETPADALAAMHRDAGYHVRTEGGAIIWPDDATRILCGDVDAWIIEAVK